MKKLLLAAFAMVFASSGAVRAEDPEQDCSRFWGSADYLVGRIKKGQTPPLVTTGPEVLFSGSLDIAGTQVLFGNDGLDYGTLSGGRASLGVWLDEERRLGVEVGGF